ncbi:MAG: hypothetical protein ABF636_04505 [Acetobacter sp.]
MMNRVKAARLRRKQNKGSVVIEAALFFIVAAALLTGFINFGYQITEYYQVNALTDHVGQIVARADTVSSSSIQAILDDTQASEATSLGNATLCVTVTAKNSATLTVPAACGCSPAASAATSSLQSAAANTTVVLVNGCLGKFQSSSIFVSSAKIGQ